MSGSTGNEEAGIICALYIIELIRWIREPRIGLYGEENGLK